MFNLNVAFRCMLRLRYSEILQDVAWRATPSLQLTSKHLILILDAHIITQNRLQNALELSPRNRGGRSTAAAARLRPLLAASAARRLTVGVALERARAVLAVNVMVEVDAEARVVAKVGGCVRGGVGAHGQAIRRDVTDTAVGFVDLDIALLLGCRLTHGPAQRCLMVVRNTKKGVN